MTDTFVMLTVHDTKQCSINILPKGKQETILGLGIDQIRDEFENYFAD